MNQTVDLQTDVLCCCCCCCYFLHVNRTKVFLPKDASTQLQQNSRTSILIILLSHSNMLTLFHKNCNKVSDKQENKSKYSDFYNNLFWHCAAVQTNVQNPRKINKILTEQNYHLIIVSEVQFFTWMRIFSVCVCVCVVREGLKFECKCIYISIFSLFCASCDFYFVQKMCSSPVVSFSITFSL